MQETAWTKVTHPKGMLHQTLLNSCIRSPYGYKLESSELHEVTATIHAYREVGTSLECSVEVRTAFGSLVGYHFFTAII